MVGTDIVRRAVPWARLILESGTTPDDLNLAADQRLSAALVAVAGALPAAGAWWPARSLGVAAAALLGVIGPQPRALRVLLPPARHRASRRLRVLLHLLYYLYSGLTCALVWATIAAGGLGAAAAP